MDGLRIFGCQAYVNIPKEERKKLDVKSKMCILVGYGGTRGIDSMTLLKENSGERLG